MGTKPNQHTFSLRQKEGCFWKDSKSAIKLVSANKMLEREFKAEGSQKDCFKTWGGTKKKDPGNLQNFQKQERSNWSIQRCTWKYLTWKRGNLTKKIKWWGRHLHVQIGGKI